KLAQALVHDPELLFLDEPTNGLDPRARDEMLELIAELPARHGCAIVLSTHLLPDVERVCDHAIILHRGQLRYAGAIANLRTSSDGDGKFAVEVKRDAELLAAALEKVGCQVTVGSTRDLSVTLPEGQGASLLFAQARQQGVQIRGLDSQRESLEAAFLRVVGGES
ncbi:MAG: AAA family ATPase, partial [Myxococcota bacterium]